MCFKIIHAFLCYFACVIAFEDLIYVQGQNSQEMQEQGRIQYQLLQERGHLPQYGSCWKEAVKHVNEGCRTLSEDTQMEIALHLTNCFLAMSGHDTYDCELNKKPNVRGICINSMSDRAFNVYTEFYTHTQNMCWFLRGQVWHETIAENTWKVGKQLEDSAKNQEKLLQNQKESLELQEKLLQYGHALEETMEKFYQSSKDHQEILSLFATSLNNLQSWLLGEISWFDTLIFYVVVSTLVVFFTSVPRTADARLKMLAILTFNFCIERLICYLLSKRYSSDIRDIQIDYYYYVWCSRYICVFLIVVVLILYIVFYKNSTSLNTKLLEKILDKIISVSKKIENLESKADCDNGTTNVSYISEESNCHSNDYKYLDSIKTNIRKQSSSYDVNGKYHLSHDLSYRNNLNNFGDATKENLSFKDMNEKRKLYPLRELRSRNGTPDITA